MEFITTVERFTAQANGSFALQLGRNKLGCLFQARPFYLVKYSLLARTIGAAFVSTLKVSSWVCILDTSFSSKLMYRPEKPEC
jgi:hypothetical protein